MGRRPEVFVRALSTRNPTDFSALLGPGRIRKLRGGVQPFACRVQRNRVVVALADVQSQEHAVLVDHVFLPRCPLGGRPLIRRQTAGSHVTKRPTQGRVAESPSAVSPTPPARRQHPGSLVRQGHQAIRTERPSNPRLGRIRTVTGVVLVPAEGQPAVAIVQLLKPPTTTSQRRPGRAPGARLVVFVVRFT